MKKLIYISNRYTIFHANYCKLFILSRRTNIKQQPFSQAVRWASLCGTVVVASSEMGTALWKRELWQAVRWAPLCGNGSCSKQ